MLTFSKLKEMEPNTIIGFGTTEIEDYWDASKTMKVKWVASRGGIHDWAIYYKLETDGWGNAQILRMGDKMHNRRSIMKCIECDDEALAMYRD